jgi:hypothetical protein
VIDAAGRIRVDRAGRHYQMRLRKKRASSPSRGFCTSYQESK